MSVEKKIKELEYRIFDLEKTIDLLTKKINHFEEVLPFHFNEFSENEPLNAENLLSLKEACTILNISESKLMEWVKKGYDYGAAEIVLNVMNADCTKSLSAN